MNCPRCGGRIRRGAPFCRRCEFRFSPLYIAPQPQKKKSALFRWILPCGAAVALLWVFWAWALSLPPSEDIPTDAPVSSESSTASSETADVPESTDTPEPTATPEPTSTPEPTATPEPTMTPEEIIENDKATYAEIDYKELLRNPEKHKGDRICFEGKITEVVDESKRSVTLRINVTNNGYGIWDDDIYVTFEREDTGNDRLLEDDIVKVYGEADGNKSYLTVLFAERTIPKVKAKYIDFVRDSDENIRELK